MHLRIVAVGKLKEKYLTMGVQEYAKRLAPYAKLSVTEVAYEKAPETLGAAEEEQVRRKEGERLLAQIKPDAYVIALAIDGELWSSEELAARLDKLATYGRSEVAFVIGGSLGLHADVLHHTDARLPFGHLTLPHQLIRLVLVEQLYRACKIIRGEPYHK